MPLLRVSWGQPQSGLYHSWLAVCSCQPWDLTSVWVTCQADTGEQLTVFHSALIIHWEFISVLGSSNILIIALVSYVYITNYRKFSALKQHKWISLGWHRGVSRAVFPSGGARRESIFLPFASSRGCPHSLAYDFFHLQSQQWPGESFTHPIPLTLTLLLSSSTFKNPCDHIGPTWINQDHFPPSKPVA